ncbi:hypothetical protein CRV24_006715 [Beauveria bassiana]|nr:hypothetical protein CRV24_006715 [Beauveria bassiana]
MPQIDQIVDLICHFAFKKTFSQTRISKCGYVQWSATARGGLSIPKGTNLKSDNYLVVEINLDMASILVAATATAVIAPRPIVSFDPGEAV